MFKHHKFCVIEVSGLLTGHGDAHGQIHLWLVDTSNEAGVASSESQKLRIVDLEFCEYIRQNASARKAATHEYRLIARITGSVNMDGGETQLGDVTAAVIVDGNRTLSYALAN